MNAVGKVKTPWTLRFIVLSVLIGALHYLILIVASGALLDPPEHKSNFFAVVVLPLFVWILSMPAQALVSGVWSQVGPGTLAFIWVANSFVWGFFWAALAVWIWRRDDLPEVNPS
jgi:hypothetical protein